MHEECSMDRNHMRVTGKTCVFGHTLYPLIAIAGMATGNVCEKMRRSYDIPGPGDRYNTNIDGYIYYTVQNFISCLQCKSYNKVFKSFLCESVHVGW